MFLCRVSKESSSFRYLQNRSTLLSDHSGCYLALKSAVFAAKSLFHLDSSSCWFGRRSASFSFVTSALRSSACFSTIFVSKSIYCSHVALPLWLVHRILQMVFNSFVINSLRFREFELAQNPSVHYIPKSSSNNTLNPMSQSLQK